MWNLLLVFFTGKKLQLSSHKFNQNPIEHIKVYVHYLPSMLLLFSITQLLD